MKKLALILLLAVFSSSFAQNDSIEKPKLSTVSADKMNVVYRGVSNPISISVTDAKSFTATGPGLSFNNGKYIMKPGQGLTVKIQVKIIKNDNSEIIEEHVFRIKGIYSPIGKINGNNCFRCIVQMKKSEFADAEISIDIEDFTFDYELNLKSFQVKFANKKAFVIEGNKFTPEVLSEINKLKKASIFDVTELKLDIDDSGYLLPRIYPIKVMIINEEIPIQLSRKAVRDSVREIKKSIKMQKKLLKKNGYKYDNY